MTFDEWYQQRGIEIAKVQGVWTMGGMTLALAAWDAAREAAAKKADEYDQFIGNEIRWG